MAKYKEIIGGSQEYAEKKPFLLGVVVLLVFFVVGCQEQGVIFPPIPEDTAYYLNVKNFVGIILGIILRWKV